MHSDSTATRLNKYLALQLGISRREADIYITHGKVTLNGTIAMLGARMQLGDTITVEGKVLSDQVTPYVYILFYKPVGYVCSRRTQGDSPTIYSLLPQQYQTLKPVGRLDRNSSGILLLTNDGDFAFHMTHPKFSKIKVYHVRLDRALEPLHQQMISDFGIQLEDGCSKLILEPLDNTSRNQWSVTMSEGRNRQIRRTFSALGYDVTMLHRIQFGDYSLGDMKPGELHTIDIR